MCTTLSSWGGPIPRPQAVNQLWAAVLASCTGNFAGLAGTTVRVHRFHGAYDDYFISLLFIHRTFIERDRPGRLSGLRERRTRGVVCGAVT